MLTEEMNAAGSQATKEVGGAAAMAAQAAEQHAPAAATVQRASQPHPRLTSWDYVQIDRLLRARRRAARR